MEDRGTMTLQPYSCTCGALLGRCSNDRLVVGGVRIVETVKVTCIACGMSRVWKPIKQKVPTHTSELSIA